MAVSRSERVLVTGAGGFTGRHLCAHLREHGHQVFGLTEHAGESLSGDVQTLCADLLDAPAMAAAIREAAPDRVVHLAAIAFPGHAQADTIYHVNVIGTLRLLEALAGSGFGRRGILLPSTGTVYGRVAASALDESAPLAPPTHYAVSKLAMEHLARLFADTLPIVVVRPFNYTGPGQHEPYLVPKLVRHFAQRSPFIELGNVDIERDFLDVRAVVDAYLRLLDTPAAFGGTFNLCSGAATSLRCLLSMLEAATGHRIEVRINPQFVREGEPPRIVGSPARLIEVIGGLRQLPLPVTLADMLREFAPS